MNAHELSTRLAEDAARIAEYLLPRGKRKGNEWKAGSTAGEEGNSLSVRITGAKRGVWRDFAAEEGGGTCSISGRGCAASHYRRRWPKPRRT